MIIYNVTLNVENGVVEEWIKWMQEEHMPELKSTGLFADMRLCRLLEQDETEAVTFSAQYSCNSMHEYNKYISEHAQEMRDKAFQRFGNRFIAFRSVMEVL